MPETYPAITIWQPWASLIAAGAKQFEFRSWPAPRALIGRRVAIHAGARRMSLPEARALSYRCQHGHTDTGLDNARAAAVLEQLIGRPDLVPHGAVLCLATLGQPIRNAELAAELGQPWANDSDRQDHSNWGWPLTDIEALGPYVPARGAQGWWTWTRSDG